MFSPAGSKSLLVLFYFLMLCFSSCYSLLALSVFVEPVAGQPWHGRTILRTSIDEAGFLPFQCCMRHCRIGTAKQDRLPDPSRSKIRYVL